MGSMFLDSPSLAPNRLIRVSILTERSAVGSGQDHNAAVRDSGSLVLSPNGKGQPEIAVTDLVPCGGPTSSSLVETQDGIGIVKFLRGKCFFISGATGFLAKDFLCPEFFLLLMIINTYHMLKPAVLIEKILRTMPDVGKIYLFIKAKDKEAAIARLKNEIINAELFKCLRETYGVSYQSFMLSKLVPVVGNVCESNLGFEEDLADEIANEVDVIINSAANTSFDESMCFQAIFYCCIVTLWKCRYDVAIDVNTRGTCHLVRFAKCQKLKLFLQVSTAYVNGQRQGRIMEKPLCLGDCIARENPIVSGSTALDIENEVKLAVNSKEDFQENEGKRYGWQDTYVFTKAMREMVVDNMRGDIPVVVIRPSVIESTWKEPFPGWMEGNRMMDPIVLCYGKRQLTGFLADPNGVLDVVPADMVVNATLAAIAWHGMEQKSDINVYQIASSVVNPLVFQDLATLLYEHYNSSPYMDSNGRPIHVPSMQLFSSMEDFFVHLWRDVIQQSRLAEMASSDRKLSQKHENICRKSLEQAKYLANIYEPYTFYGGRFDNSNTQKLMERMSENEKGEFGFDVGSMDWRDYITNVHIPGLRRHVMKGRGMCG
uniref:Fatty acyl-CoA reductase n=1 Tax=Populus trichocarpa TaxID=3694 RepID=A0A2K2A4W9_POPTR